MSGQIYIFNPEHDLCIANGDENFVPPRSAMGFAKENIDLSEFLRRPNKQRRQIIPWGWNHSLKKRLINEGIDPVTLPSEEELQFIRTHSHRREVNIFASTIEVTLQFISADTHEVLCVSTAEGCGETESDDVRIAINRCIDAMF